MWRKVLGNQYDQGVWDLVETGDSNIVIAGQWQVYNSTPHCCDAFGYKFSIMKLDRNTGNIIWHKLYDDTISDKGFRSVIELNDGSLICAGVKRITLSPTQFPTFGTIFKFSANGDSLWERNYLPPFTVNGGK
jgi:hypothetical protein